MSLCWQIFTDGRKQMKKVKEKFISDSLPSEEYSDYCDYDPGELGRLFASIWNQDLTKNDYEKEDGGKK